MRETNFSHCPYAHPYGCPRFYLSKWLLGEYGFMPKIDSQKNEYITEFWRKLNLPLDLIEGQPAISSTDGKVLGYYNFCPEISLRVFGYSATLLHLYSDEMDQERAHQILSEQNISKDDPRWNFQEIISLHYTQCKEYPILERLNKKAPCSCLRSTGKGCCRKDKPHE